MSKIEDKKKFLEDIALTLKERVSPELHLAAETFARLYYANVPLEDLRETSEEALKASVFDMWTFGQERPPEQAKIRVYTKKVKNKLLPQTIVEVIMDDMPFLVDSVTGVINSLGYSINLVIHPVMQVVRDQTHTLTKVSKRTSKETSAVHEAFIQCDILDFLSADKISVLTHELLATLDDVRLAVKDWMPMRNNLKKAITTLKKNPPPVPKEEVSEAISFLEWIADNHFTFLGFCEYTLVLDKKTVKNSLIPEEGLGILKDPLKQEIFQIFEGVDLTPANRQYIVESTPIIITKTTQVSRVHRRDPLDSITIKTFDSEGKIIGLYEFIGLFTSVAYRRSVRDIPLLRQKVSHILTRSGFSEDWHDGKTLIHILESFPRDELFQASEDWLFDTSLAILQLQNRQRLTLFVRPDKFERFVSCLVYIPRERYDSELRRKIEEILEKKFHGTLTNWQVQLGELAFARVHYTINLLGPLTFNHHEIENALREAALTWRDELRHALLTSVGEKKGLHLFECFGQGFSKGYQEQFSIAEAIADILDIEKAFSKNRLQASISRGGNQDKSQLKLKIYSVTRPLSLSDILPVLENMDLNVLNEIPFIVTRIDGQKIWIHDFEMQTRTKNPINLKQTKDNFLEGFDRIWRGDVENDGFNKLIIQANFDWHTCELMRAIAKYIRQLSATFSQVYMEETLAKYPLVCRLMMQLFICQFFPQFTENRNKEKEEILNKIKDFLTSVESLDEEYILRKFANVISSTLRTNFYQYLDGKPKPYLSFKIDCRAIDEMPLPRPEYEIFVYSPRVEAVHLRGGKIARGGIRWSDRKEDFRTEILGLMKAQMVKNAVIIPVGSKGGFIIKQPPLDGSLREEGVRCYQIMMRGLLDLTDTIQDGVIVPPQDVVCHDKADPYLVVAADKGTSTFSDYANQISAEYNFWLGDAFASGGSTGYDHKKMAITARGAWESVKRHFREMERDATKEELTVVGIGDMSGDVFGNGMLLSRHLKLVAAFNHLHIFIDPAPHPEISYQERKRLFDLSSSTWKDYNSSLISEGGGVFDRQSKSIAITSQMKALFEIQDDFLSPSDLIRIVLKTPVDLIWFGGIGTYIKATNESSHDVRDRVNDGVRINGRDVRALVIAEGANLGVTQLGRIEYAKKGGRINTDAIDNSAGVDCSDHEVNIKILLNQVISKDDLTFVKRNTLLHHMTHDVAQLVLKNNFSQVQAISLARTQGLRLLDEQARLMRDLEEEGLLNRALEYLPDETEIARRIVDKQGLTRPELAVLLAYAKISLTNQLIHSDVPDLKLLHGRLMHYFPERLQNAYEEEIATHPLKREIVATLFTGSIVNHMGITFIHEMKRQANIEGADVARAYLIVRELLDFYSIWKDLETLDNLPPSFQETLMLTIYENMKRFINWFLRFGNIKQDLDILLQTFKPDFDTLREHLFDLCTSHTRKLYEEKCREYEHLGLPTPLSHKLLSLEPLVSAPDIITLSTELSLSLKLVARVYFALGQQLGFEWLRKAAVGLSGETHWQQGAANSFVEELYANQRHLTKKILTAGKPLERLMREDGTLTLDTFSTSAVEATLSDLMNASTIDFAMLAVMNHQLRLLA